MALVDGNVLVTGATGGIGQAIARAFAPRGATLLLTGRRSDVLAPLAEETGGRALPCDLASRPDVERLIAEAGDVDVLVANAALPASGALLEYDQDGIDRALEINLRAPITLARALVPGMVARRRGHLVFISSLQGKAPTPNSSLYVATKFALRGFALALREDLRADGVGVSVVLPGFIRDAGMFADSGVRLPMGVGTRTPEQVAAAVISAIERNRAEVVVAPPAMRIGATLAGIVPELSAAVSRCLGSHEIAAAVADTQVDKR
ncbi:MAG: SDR family NAD(P)-dependent oxidoreductase [Actinomycetota bacterium]|nr:SDR family NAD(P)-dependent oxidoreductase [Actinomycetota bacterium]